ncbi:MULTISPECIES: MoxR family ATPase [Bacillaceae]|uniref:AAA family ATPase n=1 Tax=Bacillaceae TaxID=186817 RepID=UPI001BDE0DCA|nr:MULTISPECIES: MoxR family ATPase [unclassified Cytobacillus]MDX8362823.1 MoxR family ATPase [Cytobacillus sp. IB215316]MDX8367380.1 MoxR family ATPase [Cytobacillus sp. IB215665]
MLNNFQNSVNEVLIGKEKVTELLLVSILSKGHVLLEDVPGTGKTKLAKTFASLINGSFQRIQFTPDVLPSDVTGIQFFNPKEQDFQLRLGPVNTNILLADEINRATPRTQSSLLEAMEERQVTIDGSTYKLPEPFIVFATQNPVESHGTFPLPDAQLDRFFMVIPVGYPSFDEEKEMIKRYRNEDPLKHIQSIVDSTLLLNYQDEIKQIKISEDIETYLLAIIHATRQSDLIETGVSPRGTLAFMRAIQARAFLKERDYCIPEDVKELAPYILSHRLVLSTEGMLKTQSHEIIQHIIDSVEVPVESGATL